MKSMKQILRRHYGRKAVIYFLTWCLVLNTSLPVVLATPSGGAFAPGYTGTIEYGTNTAVTVNQAQSIIQWGAPGSGGINTSSAESLSFSQAAGLSNSAVLNRIMSGNPTQFDGTLNGLGMRIFIVNPAGIAFGGGSHVNVTQLVASGLNMSDADFLDATDASPTEFRFEGGSGSVDSRAIIMANQVYLIGKKVISTAGIVAPNGLVVLAAGDHVYLAQDGSSVVVEILGDPLNTTADVQNRSVISAPNGKIVLAAGDTFSRAVTNVGILTAASGTIEVHAARIDNKGWIDVSANPGANADGGTITLSGVENIYMGPDGLGTGSRIQANAGANGTGGNIALETEGTVNLVAGSQITARGGSVSGDGGSVKVTAEHFTLAGQIDASPATADYEPGTLEIDPPTVTIANGANAGATDTLYEQDIETWGTKGTSLIVYADDGITVGDIADGRIAGRYGDIELYTTGADSSISFADTTDTISTTLGDIIMDAGSGGLTIGNLQTAKDLSDIKPTPGQIALSTHDGGNITAENLTIASGWGHAEINVAASGDLMVNGDVIVGRDSAIQNIPLGQDAEAVVYLKAGDSVVLNGDVRADSYGAHEAAEGSVTRSYIGVFSGTNESLFGDTTINGDLVATAKSSPEGTSEATIEIDVWGMLTWGPDAADPVADGDEGQVHVTSKESAEDTNADGDVARVIVKIEANIPEPLAMPDLAETHMGVAVEGNVLENDISPRGEPLTAALVDGPDHAASFTLNADGSYSYTPQAGYVGPDSFTYTASSPGATSDPVAVTITMTNTLPVVEGETPTAHMGVAVEGTILDNVVDPDGDPFTTALVTTTTHGTLTLNPDGTYTYEPQAGYVGPDSFTFSATDGQIGAPPIQGTVTINMTNSLPVAEGEAQETHMGVAVEGTILDNVVDPDGDPFTTALVTTTTHGTLTLNPDGTYTYEPQAGYAGPDSFTISAVDGQIGAEPVQIMVTINVTNSQPLAEGEAQTTHMGEFKMGKILVTDPEGDPFTIALVTTTQHGTLTFYPDGDYLYQPQAGYVGPDSFTYSAVDNQIGAEPAQGTITIDVTNTLPIVKDETLTTHMGASVKGTIADNISDPEEDPFTVGLQTTTTHGTLIVNPDGNYTYQPQAGYVGTDTFTFSAWDEQIGAEPIPATVTITITNTLPSGVSDSAITSYVSPVVIGVLGNDSDPDKDALRVGSFNYTGAGTLVLNANGTFTYTPPAGFLGQDSFTYSVSDGQIGAELTETTVNITVNIGRLPPPEFFMPAGPDLDKTNVRAAGCPALMNWVAAELGVYQGALEIWIVNGLASGRTIQPCEACGTLRHAATILSDAGGVHATALAQVINEYVPSALPPSEEQMASIAEAIANRARTGNRYALAGEYLTALSDYVSILNDEIGLSVENSVKLASSKYVAPLTRSGNTVVAGYVTARLNELSVFLSLSQMEPLSPTEQPRPSLNFDLMMQ